MGCTIEPLLDNQVCKYIHSSCINAKVQDLSNILDKNKETYSTISFFSPDSKTNISNCTITAYFPKLYVEQCFIDLETLPEGISASVFTIKDNKHHEIANLTKSTTINIKEKISGIHILLENTNKKENTVYFKDLIIY